MTCLSNSIQFRIKAEANEVVTSGAPSCESKSRWRSVEHILCMERRKNRFSKPQTSKKTFNSKGPLKAHSLQTHSNLIQQATGSRSFQTFSALKVKTKFFSDSTRNANSLYIPSIKVHSVSEWFYGKWQPYFVLFTIKIYIFLTSKWYFLVNFSPKIQSASCKLMASILLTEIRKWTIPKCRVAWKKMAIVIPFFFAAATVCIGR